MKPYLSITAFLLLISSFAFAQNIRFPKEGVIEFEKRVNVYAVIKRDITKNTETYLVPALEQYKKNNPQFKTLKSTLTFSQNITLFTPAKAEVTGGNYFNDHVAIQQHNVVFSDLAAGKSICQKKVFEQNYLVKDSLRQIKWKITNETREIAGYSCRRANALIMDSIYVVAFYTDNIPVSGGPESFTGLPGMILGVALPYENITWFATSVTEKSVPVASIKAPEKGKELTRKDLSTTLQNAFKRYGDYAKNALKIFMM